MSDQLQRFGDELPGRLDSLRTRPDAEALTDRLWRRYGRRAFDMLEAIRADPRMGEDVMGSTDYLRIELHNAAEHEMVVTLDDFMRRRSKIDLVVRDEDIVGSAGLREVAEILFGDDAERRLAAYLAAKTGREATPEELRPTGSPRPA
jgi:glycerol-3-phosphate dehydrogenase